MKPYREPKPMETQYLRGQWGVRRIDVDPEDKNPGANVQLADGALPVTHI